VKSLLQVIATALFASVLTVPALASGRIVTLSVQGMTCPSCPVTVSKALNRLGGVHVVGTNLENRTVRVEVDDNRITDAKLTATTADAGYPSTVVSPKQ